MKLLELLKAVSVNKNNILTNYGNHCIFINLPLGFNYIKLVADVVDGEEESIYNLVNKHEITLSKILTIKPNSFFLGSVYLVSEKIKDAGESIQNDEDYEKLVRELIRDYAGLLNE